MKDELFKKVFIKSEADLPKDEGVYFCNRSGFNSILHLMTTLEKSYMREIRWYLLPVEPKVSVTDEEIEKKFPIEASIIIKSKGWEEPLSLEDQETIAQIILLNFRKQTGAKWVRKQLTGE
jgi:hypothetical protein